jgi:group II intron reverse transcriptase/maturase
MRNAETLLNIIRQRGQQKLPVKDMYRQLYNPELYLIAYGRLYRNKGSLTPGSNTETVDGMSLRKINEVIELVRNERYRWTPVKRVYIPKKSGNTRPLGLPTWSDKLLQEVIRLLLEAYYEPTFSKSSHGFRPGRGCHTALATIRKVWNGAKWFIEGDIKGCFDNIDHEILLKILKQDIQDNRLIQLLSNLLKAGYLENWNFNRTLTGSPQGAIVSPILANIYLNKLDQYVECELIPQYTKGKTRGHNPEYDKLYYQIKCRRKEGNIAEVKRLEKLRRQIPSHATDEANFRRLRYIRYADDFLLGFLGPKKEADEIKANMQRFLQRELHLVLSEEKTLITHASTQKARFLGYDIGTTFCDSKLTANERSINGSIALRLPASFIANRCRSYMKDGKPSYRKDLIHVSDYVILSRYQAEYRGYVQYYQLAGNLIWLNKLHRVMRMSLIKTLAHKYKTSVATMAQKYSHTVTTKHGPRKCLEVQVIRENKKPLIARFGGIPLKSTLKGTIKNQHMETKGFSRSELEQRLLAETCEVCGSDHRIEVHHIRKLPDIESSVNSRWLYLMKIRRRKTLVLCRQCHHNLHKEKPLLINKPEELPESRDAVKAARPVRRENDGKGVITTSPSFYPTKYYYS